MFKADSLYQNDPRWKDTPLGNQSSETIGSWGCLLTSMTMALNGAGYQETPATVNEKMKSKGGFQGALVLPAVLPTLFPNLVYRGFVACEDNPAPIQQIDTALTAGKPVIVQVDWNPQAGVQTHWVVLKDKKGSDYSIYDPYQYKGDGPGIEVLLTSRYKYQGTDPVHAISGVVFYDIKTTTPPPTTPKAPLPAVQTIVYAAEDDLALRGGPSVTGYLLKRMTAGTALISLEDQNTTQGKIGQMNQWLFVQDPDGDQGYTAAWYLSKGKLVSIPPAPPSTPTPQPTTPSAPAPTGGTTDLVLTPTVDGVSLRSQPVVAPENLIRLVRLGELMTATESAAQVGGKIGVVGQWLKVRDAHNQEGYVAAWYVQKSSPTPQPAPASGVAGPLTVKTTTDGVALRSQPMIADTTLIKRVPINTPLQVVEPGAENKIGVTGMWLKVKDLQNVDGYVAAWYVTL